MKYAILFILFCSATAAFSQSINPLFERLKAYSTKSDDYRVGFFFTDDTVLLTYPSAGTAGNEKQISQNHTSFIADNSFHTYNSFEFFGEMGFVNDKKYVTERDSANKVITDIALQFILAGKKYDTISVTKSYYNANWKIERYDFYTFQAQVFKNTSKKFFNYDAHNRLVYDSMARLVQNAMVPDQVRHYAYDMQNHVIMDSFTKYNNNIGALESANYYKYDTSFLLERKYLSKSGLIQLWQYYKDSLMQRDYTFLVYTNNDTNALNEDLTFFDSHGNPVERVVINLANNSRDTSAYYQNEYTYDAQFNIFSMVRKGKDQFGNWVNSTKRDYIYDDENRIIDNAYFSWIRTKNMWRMQSRISLEYAFDSMILWQKTFTSEDSVTWQPKSMTTYTYTELGNPRQIVNYVYDTLINDYFPTHVENYYWEKYFYDDNIINTSDDLLTAIYPNPSVDLFNLIFECEADGEADIRVFDVAGKTVFRKTIAVKKQINNFNWDASQYPPGLYIIQLRADSKEKSLKVTKRP